MHKVCIHYGLSPLRLIITINIFIYLRVLKFKEIIGALFLWHSCITWRFKRFIIMFACALKFVNFIISFRGRLIKGFSQILLIFTLCNIVIYNRYNLLKWNTIPNRFDFNFFLIGGSLELSKIKFMFQFILLKFYQNYNSENNQTKKILFPKDIFI